MTQTTSDNSLISLLKVNNKGWNSLLFENEMKISAALCAVCNNVCVDAVELGCEHNEDDIYLYCHSCLKTLISESDGTCPINKHSHPIIVSNRATRRQVSKATVICPYSAEFKHAQSAADKNIAPLNEEKADNSDKLVIDTVNAFGNEEKEGNKQLENQNIAVYQEQVYGNQQLKMRMNTKMQSEESTSSCDWKGTLNELIKTHLMECTEKNDPMFKLNINIKELTQENIRLNEQVSKLQTQLNEYKNENEQFEKQLNERNLFIQDLENKNDELNQQNIGLKNKVNDGIFDNEEFFKNSTETEMGLNIEFKNGDFQKAKTATERVSVNKEYLHLTASVVSMKFPHIQHITSEELIRRVKDLQIYEYHDMMICIMKAAEKELIEKKKQAQLQGNKPQKHGDLLSKFKHLKGIKISKKSGNIPKTIKMKSLNKRKPVQRRKNAMATGRSAALSVPLPTTHDST